MKINSRIRMITIVAMAGVMSAILMYYDIPLPFAPTFLKIDISELPAIVVTYAIGIIPGFITIILKNALKLVFKPTTTAFIGELMNVCVGCIYVFIAGIIYKIKHDKIGALISLSISTLLTSIIATILNAVIMFPLYVKFYGMPMDAIIDMAVKTNPLVKDYYTMMFFCVFPFNIVKYVLVSAVTFIIYKKIRYIVKA